MNPDLSKIRLGMSRDDVIRVLGEPDHISSTTRKYKTPSIYKYGDVELWFEPHKAGMLVTVWDEANEVTILTM